MQNNMNTTTSYTSSPSLNKIKLNVSTDNINIYCNTKQYTNTYLLNNPNQINKAEQLYISNQPIKQTKSTNHLFINDEVKYKYTNFDERSINKWISEEKATFKANVNHTKIPLFFEHNYTIKIPSKVDRLLRRNTPISLLKKIDSDKDVAIELCLLMLTKLNSTHFEILDDQNSEGWKALKAEYLRDFVGHGSIYKEIRIALEYSHDTGAIIECDYKSKKNLKAYNYRMGKAYINKGLVKYQLKTSKAKVLLDKSFMRAYKIAIDNPICKNLITAYSKITLPTKDEIIEEAKILIKNKYKTKKGKTLKFLGKHPKSYYKNVTKTSFVEESIEIFKYLTDNGLMIPLAGSEKSGGRIVDSFALMPSWIRSLVKIDGVYFTECDYSCLHPNIAISIYGGTASFLIHQNVADNLKLDLSTVKKEHLSFFNKEIWQMEKSPVYDYYEQNEKRMLDSIITEKYKNIHRHRATSMKMFKKEVDIMTDVIQQLNKKNINVIYVYDALLCHPRDVQIVKEIMDSTTLKHNVKTTAKITDLKFSNIKNNSKSEKTTPIISDKLIPFNKILVDNYCQNY